MARDSAVEHTEEQLREGLWRVAAGQDLHRADPLRVELLQVGYLRRAATGDGVHLTLDGRRFLDDP